MSKEKHDHGFTIWRAIERVWRREDNAYTKKSIENILKMYAEECLKALMEGEKVSIKGVGTIRPTIVRTSHCGLGTMKDKEGELRTFVRLHFHTNDLFKKSLKERLNKNMEKGIHGLKGEDECLEQ
ncbi:HU family DNA-binding protein [Clostridium sp. HBUAS56010]|uniref:HU family DNA-binding protein n=1 Tax=Clostridium sp. HBUAS56010 TaxID=2571127 RepID=UPI00163DDD8E|nr:HU family DNA-binding protein [Clostridium sp. HBUAS56010]